MIFINREKERNDFKKDYEKNIRTKTSQVYIIEAGHGIGKSQFISEVSKFFSNYPLDIEQYDYDKELSTFKRMVLELDKTSLEYGYDTFETFYKKKSLNTGGLKLLLKITAIFGQLWAKSKGIEMGNDLLPDHSVTPQKFILNAQTENIFEYAKYVFSTVHMHVIFHQISAIDSGSLDLISKLIVDSKGCIFIFESDSKESSFRIEQYLQNSRRIFLKKYHLNKLDHRHLQTYIHQLLHDLKMEVYSIESDILNESVEKGDLTEIAIILKDYNDRLKKDSSTQIRSTREIIQNLSKAQSALLILIDHANGKLKKNELRAIINELNIPFDDSDFILLKEKNLIEIKGDYVSLLPFVYEIYDDEEHMSTPSYAVASALIKYLNDKLNQTYNNRYIDILIDYYLKKKEYYQIKSILPLIAKRLKDFNTQAERVDYFMKFNAKRQELIQNDKSFPVMFAKIAYDANLYFEAMNFINLVKTEDDETIFIKALLLNRCEDFVHSNEYIEDKLKGTAEYCSIWFKLSLIQMMNLIQLNHRNEAVNIFNKLKLYTHEMLYPYLIRLSNVFYDNYEDRVTVVETITDEFYKTNDAEFSGLHAIYLAYLYALTGQSKHAENALIMARDFLGNNLIYNHMILHNEATIKFHNNEIDKDIPTLLNNAKVTAYDEYDKLAINNNLLVYYILSNNVSYIECQHTVLELETLLDHTYFKRFVDKIYYNLYHYYVKMYNFEKIEYYGAKLQDLNIRYEGQYKYKLMYETSWKLPIN